MVETLTIACEEVANAKPAGDAQETAALRSENAKLKYRIKHLKKAVDEASNTAEKDKLVMENKKLLYRVEHLKQALDAK
jgi:uncharacterized protein YbaR (Trm112 family)